MAGEEDHDDAAQAFDALRAEVVATRRAIEGQPALKLTPEAQGRAMARAVSESMADAARALREEADAIGRERRFLADIVGQARAQEAQRRARRWTIGLSALAGFVAFPMLAALAPGGSFLAAVTTGRIDRWQAGVSLMQAGDPVASLSLAVASQLLNANSEALRVCTDAAKKAGATQKCTISVAAPGQ